MKSFFTKTNESVNCVTLGYQEMALERLRDHFAVEAGDQLQKKASVKLRDLSDEERSELRALADERPAVAFYVRSLEVAAPIPTSSTAAADVKVEVIKSDSKSEIKEDRIKPNPKNEVKEDRTKPNPFPKTVNEVIDGFLANSRYHRDVMSEYMNHVAGFEKEYEIHHEISNNGSLPPFLRDYAEERCQLFKKAAQDYTHYFHQQARNLALNALATIDKIRVLPAASTKVIARHNEVIGATIKFLNDSAGFMNEHAPAPQMRI